MGKHRKAKTQTTSITFDRSARKDYLTGFSRRKKERQEKAKRELEDKIKKEKRDMKAEIRNAGNMGAHNDIVADRLKQLRNLEGITDEKKEVKEEFGQIVETSEIDMTVNLAPAVQEFKQQEEKAKDGEMNDKANRKEDQEAASQITFSRTKQKKMIGQQGQLQKLKLGNSSKVKVVGGNKRLLMQRKGNFTLSKKRKHQTNHSYNVRR